MTRTQRIQAFLEELTELSRRTGIVVSGCGCCDSPSLLVDGKPWEWDRNGWYVVNHKPDADPDRMTHEYGYTRWRPKVDHDTPAGLPNAPSVLPPQK